MVPEENKDDKLTIKQENFCNEYLIDLNGTRALIRAGFSENGAAVEAHKLLRNPKIQKRIAELRASMEKGFNVTKERIIQELSRIVFFDIRTIHTIDGAIKPVTDFDDEAAAAVAGIEVYEENLKSDDPDEQIVVGKTKKIKIA